MSIIIVIFAVVQILRLLLSIDSKAGSEHTEQTGVSNGLNSPGEISTNEIVWNQFGAGTLTGLVTVRNADLFPPSYTYRFGSDNAVSDTENENGFTNLFWYLTLSEEYTLGDNMAFIGCYN